MNIFVLLVRRGVIFLMTYLILVGFGLYSLARLQLDLFFDVFFSMVMVLISYTGASFEDMETLVIRPLESSVAAVKNATEITLTFK